MNRIDEREKIMEANIKNKNSFYRLTKKQRGRLSNHIDELSVGDTVYSTEDNILIGWKHHFENLTINSHHEHFDNKYQQKVEQEYIDIIDICRAMFQHQSNSILPTSNKATHIGICRTDDDSCKVTIDENLKKARRTLYSLMGVGLYGENGLDPQTSMSIMNTYIIPIMLYGLEIVIPRGRCLETLNIQFKKILKQLLSLPKTVADPAICIISGMLPVEAQIDVKILTFYGNITRQEKSSIEWQLAERQLNVKSINSNSWFSLLRKIFLKYELNDPGQYLVNPISKYQWKSEITSEIHKFWTEKILNPGKFIPV
ncbi:unnamed protein product [Mytilus coruscus]|uniref:Uncharacterized protein n=1 Tax=Mytilus coruscus TaxID=42192 RepID=A0A6J8B3N3_MYTCO|nr:unnamed protein product [Mytilus coruscus]